MSEYKMRNKGPKSCQYYIEHTTWAIEMIVAIKWSKYALTTKRSHLRSDSLSLWGVDEQTFCYSLETTLKEMKIEVNQICKPKLFCKSCFSWETIKIIETKFILHYLTPERKIQSPVVTHAAYLAMTSRFLFQLRSKTEEPRLFS